MEMQQMEIKQEKVNEHKVKFILPKKLFNAGMFLYAKDATETNSKLADDLLHVRGIEKVLLTPNAITLTITEHMDTEITAEDAKKKILNHLQDTDVLNPDSYSYEKAVGAVKEEDVRKIQSLLDNEVNPGLAMHGGFVELKGIKGNTVYLKFGGGCHGCGMVDVTLREGIETRIKEVLPYIKEVADVTDHESGTNPYYDSSSGCC